MSVNQELRELGIILTMRKVWEQQYEWVNGQPGWRDRDDLPPSGERIASPFDLDARFSIKRETLWVGYKAHLTETCEQDAPHVITHVETTLGTVNDVIVVDPIHQDLAQKELLPDRHFVDGGYGSGKTISTSQSQYGVELYGPVRVDLRWQARQENAFDGSQFVIDWEKRQARCPAGRTSLHWRDDKVIRGQSLISIRFNPADCGPCPLRTRCTRNKIGARELVIRPEKAYLALQMARQRQLTAEFAQNYAIPRWN